MHIRVSRILVFVMLLQALITIALIIPPKITADHTISHCSIIHNDPTSIENCINEIPDDYAEQVGYCFNLAGSDTDSSYEQCMNEIASDSNGSGSDKNCTDIATFNLTELNKLNSVSIDASTNPFYLQLLKVINALSIGVAVVSTISIATYGLRYVMSRGNVTATSKVIHGLYRVGLGVVLYLFGWSLLNWLVPNGFLYRNNDPNSGSSPIIASNPTPEPINFCPPDINDTENINYDTYFSPAVDDIFDNNSSPLSSHSFTPSTSSIYDGEHTPELVMSATRGVNPRPDCNPNLPIGRSTLQQLNNVLAPIQGHMIFNIHAVNNSEPWDGRPPHKFTSSGFTQAVDMWGATRIESTFLLGANMPWGIVDLAKGNDLSEAMKQWYGAYFDEADAWLDANPNVNWTIRLLHEMNGQWFGENNFGSSAFYIGPYPESIYADDYVTAWRRIYSFAESRMRNADRTEWLWSPASWVWGARGTELGKNVPKQGASDPRFAYPGDDFVDYVGVSYYTTESANRSVTDPNAARSLVSQINNIRQIAPSKPFGIGEFGVDKSVDRADFWPKFFDVADEYNIEFINWFYVPCKNDGDWTMMNLQTGAFEPQPGEVAAFQEGYARWMDDSND